MSDVPSISITSNATTPTPDEIANHVFPTVRRGLDGDAVRRYLSELAAVLRELQLREAALQARLLEAERRAAEPELDEATLSQALGSETARVLTAAHEAAHEIVGNAQARVEALLADAERSIAARSRAAEEQAETSLVAARATAHALHEQTEAECREMVIEAREARRHILADLAERRRSLHRQLEQLRAGKDALSGVVAAVASSVEAVRSRLDDAEDEARVAADGAGREQSVSIDDRPIEEIVAEALAAALPRFARAGSGSVEASASEGSNGREERSSPGGVATLTEEAAAEPAEGGAPSDETPQEDAGGSDGPIESYALDELFARLRADADSLDELEVAEVPPAEEAAASMPSSELEEVRILTVAEAEAASRAGHETEGIEKDAASTPSELAEESELEIGSSTVDADEPVPSDGPGEASEEPDPDAELLAARDRALELPEADLTRALKRVVRVEQNELLDACRHLGPDGDVAALFSLPGAADRVAAASVAAINAALEAGAGFIAGDIAPPRVETARRAGDLAHVLADELCTGIERRLHEGLDELASADLDPIAVANSIFREWRGARLEGLAGDAATRAFSLGTVLAARAAGTELRWVVDDGGVACPDCDDNALSGPQAAGTAFATGHEHAPIHPGCRCVLAGAT